MKDKNTILSFLRKTSERQKYDKSKNFLYIVFIFYLQDLIERKYTHIIIIIFQIEINNIGKKAVII
jgi:hypothetical protein